MTPFVLGVALVLGALCRPLFAAEEIRAERTETIRTADGVLRISVGRVSMQDWARGVAISADSARAWFPTNTNLVEKYLFFGHVFLKDSVRQVRSAALEYDPREEVAIFTGRVEAVDEGRILTARKMVYPLKKGLLDAHGAVGLVYPNQGVSVQAEALRYEAAGDSGEAVGGAGAVWVPDPDGDTLRVRADTLRFYEQGERMRFVGGVQIVQAGMRAGSQTACYLKQEGRLELEGAPEATWTQQGDPARDSVDIRADRMLLGLEGGRLSRILLYQRAEIRMEAPQDRAVETRLIRADTAVVGLSGDRLEEIKARGGVEALFRSGEGAKTDLSGDKIQMAFEEGQLDSLMLEGKQVATYVPADGMAVSRLSGGRIVIRFQDGEIRHIRADQEAVCEHTSLEEGEERIRLTGDRVELDFEEGHLQRVRSAGGVRGSYTPAKQEVPP